MLSVIIIVALLGVIVYLRGEWLAARARNQQLAAEVESLQQERQIVVDFLHDIGEAFEHGVDRERLLHAILSSVVKVTHAKSGAVFLKSGRGDQLVVEDVFGLFPPSQPLPKELLAKIATRTDHLRQILQRQPIDLLPGDAVADVCLSGEPLLVNDPRADKRFPWFEDDTLRLECFLAVPMVYRGERLGVIALANRTLAGGFTENDLNLTRSIADQAAFSISNANAFAQLTQKQQLDRDLDTAREIQTVLLPRSVPEIPGYALAAVNLPAAH
ncbi:MAG: GAF domain-containing protein, partial [Verrucomicrobiia bacterium]